MGFKDEFKQLDREVKAEQESLTYPEVEYFIYNCDSLQDQVIISLMCLSGLRIGEVVHIHKDWMDFENDVIIIPPQEEEKYYTPKTYQENKQEVPKPIEELKIWRPKSLSSAGVVPVLPWLKGNYKKILVRWFSNHNTIELGTKSVYNHVMKAAEKAGILVQHPNFHPHSCRHSFKRILKEKGYRIEDISRLMRHTSVTVTEGYGRENDLEFVKTMQKKW